MSNEYEIKLYRTELMAQVASLLQHLWGKDCDENTFYFKWKYIDNPYTENPLGIVALYRGKVVGFRGYLATKWQIGKKNHSIIMLCPGDTCVHPDHRMKGLSVAMGNLAMKEYESDYKILINFSTTKNSLPGYLKMGFFPLVVKSYVTRYSLSGLMRFFLAAKKRSVLSKAKITFGEFGNIVVQDMPRPEEMSAIIAREDYDNSRITLFQDKGFFRWRFNNKRHKYIFYYCRENNITTGYVVMGVSSPNNRSGYILDYSESGGKAIEKIMRHIIKMKHFDILSIYNFGLNNNLSQILKGLSFKTNTLIRKIERIYSGNMPLLIRPVKRKFDDNDWFIHDLDTRNIESWQMKPICSDAV